jgi:NADPH:quinone reductase-like Zn-dependent oxidoreductase
MKAFYMTGYGGPEVMQYGDVEISSLQSGEALVEVKAVSVNPVDWKVREGQTKFITGKRFPKILGADFAGKITELSEETASLKKGDSVYGSIPIYLKRQGALAEKFAVSIKSLRKMPANWSYEVAAALPVAALTALNGLRQCGNLAEKNILINGGTGGVGHFALQIAVARGAKVTVTCSSKNFDVAKSLGASHVVDYRKQDLTAGQQKFDIIFDAYGKMNFNNARKILIPNGIYISSLGTPAIFLKKIWSNLWNNQKFLLANFRGKPEDYQNLENLIEGEQLKPRIAITYTLDQAHLAFEALEKGGVAGKIIVTTGNS